MNPISTLTANAIQSSRNVPDCLLFQCRTWRNADNAATAERRTGRNAYNRSSLLALDQNNVGYTNGFRRLQYKLKT